MYNKSSNYSLDYYADGNNVLDFASLNRILSHNVGSNEHDKYIKIEPSCDIKLLEMTLDGLGYFISSGTDQIMELTTLTEHGELCVIRSKSLNDVHITKAEKDYISYIIKINDDDRVNNLIDLSKNTFNLSPLFNIKDVFSPHGHNLDHEQLGRVIEIKLKIKAKSPHKCLIVIPDAKDTRNLVAFSNFDIEQVFYIDKSSYEYAKTNLNHEAELAILASGNVFTTCALLTSQGAAELEQNALRLQECLRQNNLSSYVIHDEHIVASYKKISNL